VNKCNVEIFLVEMGGGKLSGFCDILGNILVESHKDSDVFGFGIKSHLFKLGYCGSSRFFEKDGGAAYGEAGCEKGGVGGCAGADDGYAFGGVVAEWWNFFDGLEELNAVCGFEFFFKLDEFIVAGGAFAGVGEKPWFYYIVEARIAGWRETVAVKGISFNKCFKYYCQNIASGTSARRNNGIMINQTTHMPESSFKS